MKPRSRGRIAALPRPVDDRSPRVADAEAVSVRLVKTQLGGNPGRAIRRVNGDRSGGRGDRTVLRVEREGGRRRRVDPGDDRQLVSDPPHRRQSFDRHGGTTPPSRPTYGRGSPNPAARSVGRSRRPPSWGGRVERRPIRRDDRRPRPAGTRAGCRRDRGGRRSGPRAGRGLAEPEADSQPVGRCRAVGAGFEGGRSADRSVCSIRSCRARWRRRFWPGPFSRDATCRPIRQVGPSGPGDRFPIVRDTLSASGMDGQSTPPGKCRGSSRGAPVMEGSAWERITRIGARPKEAWCCRFLFPRARAVSPGGEWETEHLPHHDAGP